MEYHKERFKDWSLIVYKNGEPLALLAAHEVGEHIHSHSGLTYGGLILSAKTTTSDFLNAFGTVLHFLHENGFSKFDVKTIPSIYHKLPSDELHYAAFLADANLTRRDFLSVVDLSQEITFSNDRLKGLKRGLKCKLEVRESDCCDAFWKDLLVKRLQERFNTDPVHSLDEITRLKDAFPKNIRQFNVYMGRELVAGTTLFVSDKVVHSQYIAADGRENLTGALDFLHIHLLKLFKEKKQYFDFGISNEDEGRKFNSGLAYWKEGFMARGIVHDFYSFQTKNYLKLLQR